MVISLKAREMFEKLGYEYEESYDKNLIDYYKKHNNLNLEVLFNKGEKTFCFTYVTNVDIKLLQAINQQVEELGWNE